MEEVTEITGEREGTNKNGKPYTMTFITTDSGKEASTFDDVVVGDKVEITVNGKYINAKVVPDGVTSPTEPKTTGDGKLLAEIMAKLVAMHKDIKELRGEDREIPLDEVNFE